MQFRRKLDLTYIKKASAGNSSLLWILLDIGNKSWRTYFLRIVFPAQLDLPSTSRNSAVVAFKTESHFIGILSTQLGMYSHINYEWLDTIDRFNEILHCTGEVSLAKNGKE